ncbi:hypothetical protein [Nonomuraea sp. NPDC050691]
MCPTSGSRERSPVDPARIDGDRNQYRESVIYLQTFIRGVALTGIAGR